MEKEGSGGVGGSGGGVITSGGGGPGLGVGGAQETGTSRHIISTSPITIISFFFIVTSCMLLSLDC